MHLDTIFGLGSTLATIGWVVLLASPLVPRASEWIAGRVIPLALALPYTALVLAFWSGSEGGFETLEAVVALLAQPEIALAGWLHFLAFDLFVGAWIVATARREGIGFGWAVPCLALTFLFGPAGLLAFFVLRAAGGTLSVSAARRSDDHGPTALPALSENRT